MLGCGHVFHDGCIRAHFSRAVAKTCSQCTAAAGWRGDYGTGMGMETATNKIHDAAERLKEVMEEVGRATRALEMLGEGGERNQKGKRRQVAMSTQESGRGPRKGKKNEGMRQNDKERRARKIKMRKAGEGKRKSMRQGSDSEEWEWDTDEEK